MYLDNFKYFGRYVCRMEYMVLDYIPVGEIIKVWHDIEYDEYFFENATAYRKISISALRNLFFPYRIIAIQDILK